MSLSGILLSARFAILNPKLSPADESGIACLTENLDEGKWVNE
jgi:hypothetical protein